METGMILELDIGNSFIKWQVVTGEGSDLVACGQAADTNELTEAVQDYGLSRVLVANVGDSRGYLVSSNGIPRISTLGPKTWRWAQSSRSPFIAASVLDGITDFSHWIG